MDDAFARGRASVANELLHRGIQLPVWLQTFCSRIVARNSLQ